MNDNFEISLLSSGSDFMKKGYACIANNAGKTIAVITVFVTALVLFTDIGFAEIGSKTFTSTMAIMLISSYLVYFSMEDAGERLGEECKEYREALQKYKDISSKINGEDIEALRDFCDKYSLSELAYRKSALLMRYGYSIEEYKRYKEMGEVRDKKARKVFKKAEHLRAVSISPSTLLAKGKNAHESELKSPESSKLITLILKLIPCTLSMSVTVSLILTTKENMCVATVIDGLLKLSSLPIIGFKGYASGYNYTRCGVTVWLETKARLLNAFHKKQQIESIH